MAKSRNDLKHAQHLNGGAINRHTGRERRNCSTEISDVLIVANKAISGEIADRRTLKTEDIAVSRKVANHFRRALKATSTRR